ncbi:hypothetical protein [Streptomyces sp. A1547]|uniref:hypothetical protein n=1 Tax=Streptomyces sp. A1547 TaxID=2563105 RepID=UPI00109E8F26|nr:hypothetical protein [Streptomyces sp. A1547]THA30540.1 hypothetical protein E6W17_37520 [Streptomyces sp. A1547]
MILLRSATAGLAFLLLCSLTGCSAAGDRESGVRYSEDFARHEPLTVQGQPSAGSLQLVQETVWRIADGDGGKLASLGSSDGTDNDRKQTAQNWIKEFREGAEGGVTADFYGSGIDRQAVVLYFHKTNQIKAINVRLDGNGGEDGWRLKMLEPDPTQVKAKPDWVPPVPRENAQVREANK